MSDGASRIFSVMQNSGTDTVSNLLSLTVASTNPIRLTDGDKLIVPNELCIFHSSIDTSRINVGDKFIVITLNSGKSYYIVDVISSTNELNKNKQLINSLDTRVTALENRI